MTKNETTGGIEFMGKEGKCREAPCMTRRIGSTVYQVKIFFGSGGETMADKIGKFNPKRGLGKPGKV